MVAEAHLWHYLVAIVLFALFGVAAHVSRAIFNVYPDRLSDKPTLDMLISDGYDLSDRLLGTEYDDAGYYMLDSWKNLRNTVWMTVIGFLVLTLILPDGPGYMAYAINESVKWLWELFLYRLSEAGMR